MVSGRSESEPRLKGRCQRRWSKVNLAGNNGRPGSCCFLFAIRKGKFQEREEEGWLDRYLDCAIKRGEEILRRYNPCPEKTKRKWGASLCISKRIVFLAKRATGWKSRRRYVIANRTRWKKSVLLCRRAFLGIG